MKSYLIIFLFLFVSNLYGQTEKEPIRYTFSYSLGYHIKGVPIQEKNRYNNRIFLGMERGKHTLGLLYRWHDHENIGYPLVRNEDEQLYGIEYLYSVFKFLDVGLHTYYSKRFLDVDLFVVGSPSDHYYDIVGLGTTITPKLKIYKSIYLHGKFEIPIYEYIHWERIIYYSVVPGGQEVSNFVDREYFGRDYNIYLGFSITI